MNSPPTADVVWLDQAKDILELLSIYDPNLLENISEYWKRVALNLNISPKGTEVENARACLERVNGEWEESYSEGHHLAVEEVYGEFYSLLINLTTEEIRELQAGEYQPELPLEEEEEQIDDEIRHDTHQKTVGDLVGQILSRHIRLDPQWQRQFVWPLQKSQKYIESILLNIPTPSILLYLNEPGSLGVGAYHTVVDGRQRMETLLRFCATREELEELKFSPRRIRTPKGSEQFKNFQETGQLAKLANLYFHNIDEVMRIAFKNRLVPVTIVSGVKRGTLYHIFGRYNTGSEKLNPAEIRNAVYQDSAVHRTLWDLARESVKTSEESPRSTLEATTIQQLRTRMGNKRRYGTYDFIGRVMAFTHIKDSRASVNVVTNRFFDTFEGDHDALRNDFVEAFRKVVIWYDDEFLFVKPHETRSRFHAWAATIQIATAHHLRLGIENSDLDEQKVIESIKSEWCEFAGVDLVERVAYAEDRVGGANQPPIGIFQMRQNAANFWAKQDEWLKKIKEASKSSQ